MQNKKLLSLILLLSVLSILPAVASAQTITGIVQNLASIVTNVAIFVTVVFWIITGLLFITAQGDPGKLGTARKALVASIIGTAIAFLAGSATAIIGNALLSGT